MLDQNAPSELAAGMALMLCRRPLVSTPAQAPQTLRANDKWKGRAFRAGLYARAGESGQRFQQAKPVGMASEGLCDTVVACT